MKSTQRIALLLALVFLLPALFFSVYEMSSLDKDEKMIQDIYGKQLEAILFSVNQYSDDVVSAWTSRIETGLDAAGNDSIPAKIKDVLNLNACLTGVFVVDSATAKSPVKIFSLEDDSVRAMMPLVPQALEKLAWNIQQLVAYKKSGFQKMERLDIPGRPDVQCLIFIARAGVHDFRVCGLLIDASLFIEDILGPRLQTVARDQFVLTALRNNNQVVYSTLSGQNVENQAEAVTKDFWIFPGYSLGIRTVGNTLQQLVRDRTRSNVTLLIGLDVILIVAVILVYRNLKKEVDLAQNKSDFVSNVSHEIRTPLALISMFAETLEMNRVPTEEKKQEYYRIISKETQRLTGIVNKILNFSQTEAKKKTLHPEKLNLHEEIKSILKTYDFHLHNKGFQYSLLGTEDVFVHADREALIEVIINLIDNAVKYSEDKKQIEVTVGKNGQQGFAAIKDSGVGISLKDQKYIFDKFYRVPKGNLARSRGTGLGLSLVKQLMESQEGKINVSSEPGLGSTFTIYFPLE